MAMVCPQCGGTFDGKTQCPKCGVAMRYEAPKTLHMSGRPAPAPKWHQTPAGRVAVGWLIAVGLSYGLLQLSVTLLPVIGKTGANALSPELALALFYGLQALAVFVGGVITGVAQRNGFKLGAVVGGLSGVAVLVTILSGFLDALLAPFSSNLLHTGNPADAKELISGIAVHQATVYGLVLLHLLCGTLGGWLGGLLFKPAPELGVPILLSTEAAAPAVGLSTAIAMAPIRPATNTLFAGPIAWVQCIFGIAFAVFVGAFGPKPIQRFIELASEGALKISDHQQDYVTAAEIFALGIFIGGAIGGAGCKNGLKQGIVIGIGAGLAMIPFIAKEGQNPLYIGISAAFLAPLGGWFGSSLLPPPPPPRLSRGAID